MQRCYIISLLWMAFQMLSLGQTGYIPIDDDEEIERSILKDMGLRYQSDIKKLDGKLKKELEAEYSSRFKNMSTKTQEGHFITNKAVNTYFNTILNNILTANPFLQKRDLRLLISRYDWPNASCHGEGSIVMNLGLINRLENESQLAFVLCHELAHDYLDHVNNAIHQYVETIYSKEAQQKLKALRRAEYNVYDELVAMMQSISFDMRRHGRLHEEEADSLALVFLQPTIYDTKEAIRALEILDKVDKPKRSFLIDYKRLFDSEAFQVKNRWFVYDTEETFIVSTSEEDQSILDSLKTHPECQQRIAALKDFPHKVKQLTNDNSYAQYIRMADYEIVASSHFFSRYGKALFYSFLLLEENPEDVYLHTMVVDCLFELYHHQKDHELGKVLDLPDKSYEENYNQFLHFLHNVRLSELAQLAHFYAYKHGAAFQDNEDFRVSELFAASLIEDRATWQKRKLKYFSDFPEGEFKQLVREYQPFK